MQSGLPEKALCPVLEHPTSMPATTTCSSILITEMYDSRKLPASVIINFRLNICSCITCMKNRSRNLIGQFEVKGERKGDREKERGKGERERGGGGREREEEGEEGGREQERDYSSYSSSLEVLYCSCHYWSTHISLHVHSTHHTLLGERGKEGEKERSKEVC